MELENTLRKQVSQVVGQALEGAPVTKLKGDASNRSYFRVGRYPESHVVMVMPKDGAAKSEEASKGDAPKELPFVNVHRYLAGLDVRVPNILQHDERAGMMVLEDLGDITFERALPSEGREAMYGSAVDLLARLRAQAERRPDRACLAFTRVFDEDLYLWEFHHFREWGMEAWSGRKPQGEELTELEGLFRKLSKMLASAPTGFTHRDYQSRNLMVKGGELVVIDFQDALQGPRQYDLVALLRDSYVELDYDFVEHMLDRYIDRFEADGGVKVERAAFKSYFDLLTVQRKLKDAARFEYIHRVKNNPGFLVSIPASLRYVRTAFERRGDVPELKRLRAIAARYVPELA
jgi:aminoglycoside/choline kinase family phosphotransferase